MQSPRERLIISSERIEGLPILTEVVCSHPRKVQLACEYMKDDDDAVGVEGLYPRRVNY